jgi:8-oxo-dGTP pyrophosphatase MutT (NUDIX family)
MLTLTNSIYSKSIRKPSTNHRFIFNSNNNKYNSCNNYSNKAQYDKYKVQPISYSTVVSTVNNINIENKKQQKMTVAVETLKEKEVTKRGGIIFVSRKYGIIKLLVVKGNGSGIYSFPKGKQNDNETLETCAIREVCEETGISINEDELIDKKKCKIGKNTYFILEVDEDQYQTFEIYDTREVCEVSWKTIDELKEINCNKDIRNVLQYPVKKFYYHNFIFTV